MKNKNNNEGNKTCISYNIHEKEKSILKFKQRMNKPGNLIEYFAIIGVEPKISSKIFLHELSPSDISKFYTEELEPKLLTKFPPIDKSYINIEENICELCFPEKIKIEKYETKPKPIIYRYLLGNAFYSFEHPLQYLTCLKFYESLSQYKQLHQSLKKADVIKKNNSFDLKDNVKGIFYNELNKEKEKRNKSLNNKNIKEKINKNEKELNNLSQYYIPKIICLISLKPCYNFHEKILYQLYDYSQIKKVKIPIEKIVLNILCNITIPPRGIHYYQYNMCNDFKRINIISERMNRLKNFDKDLNIIFQNFNIDNFIEIFKYTLFEIKTIIFSTNINNLCTMILCLISILYPFIYPFQVSSCVREDAFEILESISPYILGINQKYDAHFFSKNKIENKKANFLIIDLDNKEYYTLLMEDLPEIPKGILKKFKAKLETNLAKYQPLEDKEELTEEENTITFAFYEFLLNVLINYAEYLNKENLKKNFKITNLNVLFKTKEFINSHSNSERAFYKTLTSTQMFNDFIFKKMIPRDINDKLDILLFDENINKINNKKIFMKKKSTSFLLSKEYEYKSMHKIPKVNPLMEEELDKYKNNNYYIKNVSKGQVITFEKNDYFFNYILFPKFNEDFFNHPSNEFFLYFYTMENISNDINRVNTDLLAKSHINIGGNDYLLNDDDIMLDYIYLAYIEVWGYGFWYQDLSEREYRFKQLMEVLDKIKRQELEIFNILFEMLNKFHETEKIEKLYYKLLEYKLVPNSFIYSIVGKNVKNEKGKKNMTYMSDIYKDEKNNFQRRTFKSENDLCIFGDNIYFDYIQECPECGRKIDIKNISKDYKRMKRELLWAQCPLCLNQIKPQMSVILGNDIFPGKINFGLKKKEFFSLHSPYELKNNIKYIVEKEQFHLMDIDKLKIKFSNIFWNCIWYFYLYELDYSIILPYEINIYKKISSNNGILTPFIITKVCPFIRTSTSEHNNNIENKNIIEEDNNIKNEIIINEKNDNNTIYKNESKNNFIIHSNISFQYTKANIFRKKFSMNDFFNSIKPNNMNNNNLHSSLDKYKTPNKTTNNNKEEETDKNKSNISKTTTK